MVAMAKKIEPLARAESQANQVAARFGPGKKGARNGHGHCPSPLGATRDKVAACLGTSSRTLARAQAVAKAAEEQPELYGSVAENLHRRHVTVHRPGVTSVKAQSS